MLYNSKKVLWNGKIYKIVLLNDFIISTMNIIILFLNYGGKMKKIIVTFTYVFLIFNIIECSNVNSSNFEKNGFYTLNRSQKVQIGKDIPEGIYIANVLSDDKSSLNFNIKNEDWSIDTLYAVSEEEKSQKFIYDNLQLKREQLFLLIRKLNLG